MQSSPLLSSRVHLDIALKRQQSVLRLSWKRPLCVHAVERSRSNVTGTKNRSAWSRTLTLISRIRNRHESITLLSERHPLYLAACIYHYLIPAWLLTKVLLITQKIGLAESQRNVRSTSTFRRYTYRTLVTRSLAVWEPADSFQGPLPTVATYIAQLTMCSPKPTLDTSRIALSTSKGNKRTCPTLSPTPTVTTR
jgi:hypothetical protein